MSGNFGVYVHLPFCASRCGYCDFSIVVDQDELQETYIACLEHEIGFWGKGKRRFLQSLYFGGGTPSRFEDRLWERLFARLEDSFSWNSGTEITSEANPESATLRILERWRALGINRISLGVQTFDSKRLQVLGRRHTPERALEAVRCIKDLGFDSWSLDLIYGLPGQTVAEWQRDLDTALSLEPPHLSFYNLILHPGHPVTELALAERRADFETAESEMFLLACDELETRGYEVYELSNAARPGHACRHNLLYWSGGEWLGLGMSGSSYEDGVHFTNPKGLQPYLETWQSVPRELPLPKQTPSAESRLLDFVMLRLRTRQGFELESLHEILSVPPPPAFDSLLSEMKRHGYLRDLRNRVALTPTGWLIHSEITTRILASLTA